MKDERVHSEQGHLSDLVTALHRRIYDAGLAVERYRSRLALKRLRADASECTYLERPADGETVVLIHGFTGSKDNWLAFTRHLPRNFHVLAPDLCGHGDNSADIERDLDLWSVTDALHGLLAELGCRSFHLVGHSLGGLIASGYAARHPEHVRSLFLVCPAGANTAETSDCFRLIEAGDNPFLCRTRPEFDRLCDLIFHGPTPLAGIAQTFLSRDQIERRDLFSKMWSDLHARTEQLEPILESIEAPTKVVWGRHDRVLHPTSMETFERHVSDVDTAWLDCGHAPPVECPAELARFHAELLSRVAAS